MLTLAAKDAGLPRFRLEHMAIFLSAAVAAHLPSRWRKKGRENFEKNTFWATLASLVLIYIGVAILPGGWNL